MSDAGEEEQDAPYLGDEVFRMVVSLTITERRLKLAHQALRKIRDEEGKVCGMAEICQHESCRSSYAAWAIADAALKGQP